MGNQYLDDDVIGHILRMSSKNVLLSFYYVSHKWKLVVKELIKPSSKQITLGTGMSPRHVLAEAISCSTRRQLDAVGLRCGGFTAYKRAVYESNLPVMKWLYKRGFPLDRSIWYYFYYDSVIDISVVKWLDGKFRCVRIPSNVSESYIRNGDYESIKWLISIRMLLPDGIVIMLIDRGDMRILELVLDSYFVKLTDQHISYAKQIGNHTVADYLTKRIKR